MFNKKTSSGGFKGRKKSNFQIIGNVSVAKSTIEALGEDIVKDLQGSNIKMQLYITADGLSIEKGQKLLLSLQEPGEKDKEWVVGKLLIGE